jgi:hypothetical protein
MQEITSLIPLLNYYMKICRHRCNSSTLLPLVNIPKVTLQCLGRPHTGMRQDTMSATWSKERSIYETNEVMKTAAHRSESWCWRIRNVMSWCLSWRSWCAAALIPASGAGTFRAVRWLSWHMAVLFIYLVWLCPLFPFTSPQANSKRASQKPVLVMAERDLLERNAAALYPRLCL